MSKPMATTLPWRTKPPERVRRIEIKSPVARPGFLFALWKKELHGTARDICCPCGNAPVPAAASGQAHQWPQQQHDARYQRAEAARQDEKKKVFHAAILFLQRRRLSRQFVPAISRLRSSLPQIRLPVLSGNLARLPFEFLQARRVIFLRTALAKEAAGRSLDLLNLC
jgi:hypothetical protein